MAEITLGFFLGIVSSIIAAILLNYLNGSFFAKKKYKRYLGKYSHPNGIVVIKHLKEDYFQANGLEKSGIQWISNLKYLGNSVFIGVYDWNCNSDENNAWGEHNLHILPNGNISVIWINKSVQNEEKGRLIWTKID